MKARKERQFEESIASRTKSLQNNLSARKERQFEESIAARTKSLQNNLSARKQRQFEESIAARTKRLQNNLSARKQRKNKFAETNNSELSPLQLPTRPDTPIPSLNVELKKRNSNNSTAKQRKPTQIDLAEKYKSAKDELRAIKGTTGPKYLKKEEASLIAYIKFKLSLKD